MRISRTTADSHDSNPPPTSRFNRSAEIDPIASTTPERATLTVPEAAYVLGISRSTAYELARTGQLPVLHLGRRLVIPAAALDLLLQSATHNSD